LGGRLKGATPDEQRALDGEIAEYKYKLVEEYNKTVSSINKERNNK
jgi:hypothetical protein